MVDYPVDWEVSDYGDVDEQIKDQKLSQNPEFFKTQLEQNRALLRYTKQSACSHRWDTGNDNHHTFERCVYCGKERELVNV